MKVRSTVRAGATPTRQIDASEYASTPTWQLADTTLPQMGSYARQPALYTTQTAIPYGTGYSYGAWPGLSGNRR
jgi:hypothetical protein